MYLVWKKSCQENISDIIHYVCPVIFNRDFPAREVAGRVEDSILLLSVPLSGAGWGETEALFC